MRKEARLRAREHKRVGKSPTFGPKVAPRFAAISACLAVTQSMPIFGAAAKIDVRAFGSRQQQSVSSFAATSRTTLSRCVAGVCHQPRRTLTFTEPGTVGRLRGNEPLFCRGAERQLFIPATRRACVYSVDIRARALVRRLREAAKREVKRLAFAKRWLFCVACRRSAADTCELRHTVLTVVESKRM